MPKGSGIHRRYSMKHKISESVITYIDNKIKTSAEKSANDEAVEDIEKTVKVVKDRFNQQRKERDDFIKVNHKRETTGMKNSMFKKMHLSESLFEDDEAPSTEKKMYYRASREPLADIIQMELTSGEPVYLSMDGVHFTPSVAPSKLFDEAYVSVGYTEEDEPYIEVQTSSESRQEDAAEVGRKYNKKVFKKTTKWGNTDRKYITRIMLTDDDFDGSYYDPRVLSRGKK